MKKKQKNKVSWVLSLHISLLLCMTKAEIRMFYQLVMFFIVCVDYLVNIGQEIDTDEMMKADVESKLLGI